jgi:hypothetical protein
MISHRAERIIAVLIVVVIIAILVFALEPSNCKHCNRGEG